MKKKDLNRANEIFVHYISENPNNFNGHYYLGLTLLFKAESGLTGFFRFRKSYAEKAVEHLQIALKKIDDNARREANCYWFLGKAYLMRSEKELAKSEFQKILALSEPNLKRKKDAEAILREIESLQ